MSIAPMHDVVVRRLLRPGDTKAIADLHDRVYSAEYGLDGRFRASVARGLEDALHAGWPERADRQPPADEAAELLDLPEQGLAL